jgi:predicted DNA-binding protein (MmcQ/YjbR family)
MQDETVQKYARERADELPVSSLEHPFGPDWDAYKVRDKVFMLMTDRTGERARRPVDPAIFGRGDR